MRAFLCEETLQVLGGEEALARSIERAARALGVANHVNGHAGRVRRGEKRGGVDGARAPRPPNVQIKKNFFSRAPEAAQYAAAGGRS